MIKFGQRYVTPSPPPPPPPHPHIVYFTIRSTHKETTSLIGTTKVLSLRYKKRFYASKEKEWEIPKFTAHEPKIRVHQL